MLKNKYVPGDGSIHQKQGVPMFLILLLAALLLCLPAAYCQKELADSLTHKLLTEKTDTGRIILLNQIAAACQIFNPDSSLVLLQKSLDRSRALGYRNGENKALKIMANTFIMVGNYPRALELHLQLLKSEEKENNLYEVAEAYISMGSVYVLQEQYREGLQYYLRADSIISAQRFGDLRLYTSLNLGDLYDRLNILDSSFSYFSQALQLAGDMHDSSFMAASKVGLGDCYLKIGRYDTALRYFQEVLPSLKKAGDEDMLCETTLDLAKLYERKLVADSAAYYAGWSLELAKKDGYQSRQLDAVQFLSDHYKNLKNIDSAFLFMNQVKALSDSIDSREKIRQIQVLSTNEKLRELQVEEARKRAEEERRQQLQLLLIGAIIPGIFLVTLLLSRIRIHIGFIKLLGILSLLIFFEYLTLLLHPIVVEFTHHTPVYEILIFVAIAALLIPTHHRVEHWFIGRLTQRKASHGNQNIKLKIQQLKAKKPGDHPETGR